MFRASGARATFVHALVQSRPSNEGGEAVIAQGLFDFDGTLADSLRIAVELYNGVAERRGYAQITRENLAELRMLSVLGRCRRLGVPVHRLPGLVVEVGRLYRQAAGRA